MQAVTNSTSGNLNIAVLKAGNYLLRIKTNNATVSKAFIIYQPKSTFISISG